MNTCPDDGCCEDGDCVSECTGDCRACDPETNKCENDESLCASEDCLTCNDDGWCETDCDTGKCCDGSGNCEELGDYSPYNFTAVFSFNPALVQKVEDVIDLIPGVDIELDQVEGTWTKKARDCCDSTTGLKVENGQRKAEREITLTGEIAHIPIWDIYVNDAGFDWGFLVVEADAQVGVWASSDVSVGGMKGKREDDCGDEDCEYGKAGGTISVSINGGAEAIGCVKIGGVGGCADIIGTVSGSIEFSGQVSHDLADCDAGWVVGFDLDSIGASAEFTVDGCGISLGPWNIYP